MVALLLCLLASAEPPDLVRLDLTPVNAGVTDVSPLAIDSRLVPMDLRQDAGFERVYRLDPEVKLLGGSGPGFARRAGAITATFSRSEYWTISKWDQSRTYAAIPAGTVFQIQGGFRPTPGPAPEAQSHLRADLWAAGAAPTVPHPEPRGQAARGILPGATIWTDEAFRIERVTGWLDAAAGR